MSAGRPVARSSGRDAGRNQQIEPLLAALAREMAAVEHALPAGVTVARVRDELRAALTRTPELLQCDPTSILRVAIEAAQIGLPIGIGGLAYAVPWWDGRLGRRVAQLVVGWRGLLVLARQCPDVTCIDAHVVRESDTFRASLGTEPRVEHEPALDGGELVGAYAIARVRGELMVEVMSRRQIDAVADISRRGSRSGERSAPWREHYDEMARKTVLRRLVKRLPLTERMLAVLDEDEMPAPEPVPVGRAPARVVGSAAEAITVAAAAARITEPAPEAETDVEAQPEPELEPDADAPLEPEPPAPPVHQPAPALRQAAPASSSERPQRAVELAIRDVNGQARRVKWTRSELMAWIEAPTTTPAQLAAFLKDNNELMKRYPEISTLVHSTIAVTPDEE